MAESGAAEKGSEREEGPRGPVGLCPGVPCSVCDSDLQPRCPEQDSCPQEGERVGGDDLWPTLPSYDGSQHYLCIQAPRELRLSL